MKTGAALVAALICLVLGPVRAEAAPDRAAIVNGLCQGGPGLSQAADQLLTGLPGATPDDLAWANRVVGAFAHRQLLCSGDGRGYLASGAAGLDAATLAPVALPADATAPFPSLRARIVLERMEAALALVSPVAPSATLAAIGTLQQHNDSVPPALVSMAIARSHDAQVTKALRRFGVLQGLHAPDTAQRIAAIHDLSRDTTSDALGQLRSLRTDPGYAADPAVAAALDQGIAHVQTWVHVGNVLALLYNGLSAGSILFMSAIGLAVIFGLMGVINLAQGELIMIGAYTAYCVQQVVRAVAPAYISLYPILAIPVVFLVTAAIGIIIEATVIRHLYRRPLMTLLATWGISLLLINLVRVGFGPQNLEFITPSYLTGGVSVVGDFFVTWNHLAAIIFAVLAFLGTLALLRLTSLGLFIRGVTQNRDMAGCIGVSARRIDMLAFGFGAGLAGLAGLAVAPIYNVNPSMGADFIIDSFMVVVLGGVGSLVGTAIAAFGIGLVNVGIEPFYGAVAAKVIALLLIIAIIQWRPEGLIAIKGRR
ncbi:MAG TPA: urea ABC transporter permease subunit UrtB [Acidocella sp.]|uniref:urea ABC transporter permease subunit UrtB n=1 Tax=Acidocella sp. TaxID=50710 RepID=UPI002CCFB862|nr:urea ABC transporter permease subunit UrtB [Acidocella sp.]HVE21436.1 urea ABC transporter permease subunit UrtB [Acidocella sp.]